jgi:hypothetical protein
MVHARHIGIRRGFQPGKAALLTVLAAIACLIPRAARSQSAPASLEVEPSSISLSGPPAIADREWPQAFAASSFDLQSETQQPSPSTQQPSPQAPQPQSPSTAAPQGSASPSAPATAAKPPDLPDAPSPAHSSSETQNSKSGCTKLPCPTPIINWYLRFENGPQVKPLTPKEKAWLATKNVIDPFNMITILGEAGISVAADSHSAYGPGFPGWGRNVGVSFSEDITGEFFGTFLIPSIVHQDPHYHRMPTASYTHRVFHAIYQVVWTKGDNGKDMLNYANLVGFGIDDEIANLYVPGRQTNGPASAERYAIGLATAPIDNFISEFLPDVAKRIHVQIVVVQRIIDQVANKDGS